MADRWNGNSVTFEGLARVINYPNHFNPEVNPTVIRYELSENSEISVNIYDVSGRLVRSLVENSDEVMGRSVAVLWDGKNGRGDYVANNVYFCVIESKSGLRSIRKIAVIR